MQKYLGIREMKLIFLDAQKKKISTLLALFAIGKLN